MTSAPVEVQDWTKEGKSFSPTMTADVSHLGRAMPSSRSRPGWSPRGSASRTAPPAASARSHRQLVRGILGLVTANDGDILDRTLLAVEATTGGDGTRLTIAVAGGGEHRAGRTRGRAGLTIGLHELQRRGAQVTTTPWR